MKYIINKKIYRTAFWLCILLISYVTFQEGLSIFKQSADITCPKDAWMPCEFKLTNGSQLTLQAGETYTYNSHRQQNINLANYGSLLIVIIATLLNHFIYNKQYTYKDFKTNINMEQIIKKELDYYIINNIKLIIKLFKR